MQREKLLEEYKVTLESLVSKTEFIYSDEFYKLDECEKQKYSKDKMTTEAHLSTLCELLWGKKVQFDNGIGSMFAIGLLGSMFNSGWGSTTPSVDYLKKQLEEDEKKESEHDKDEHYAFPV